jgi:hypothetical protein
MPIAPFSLLTTGWWIRVGGIHSTN